MKRTKPTGPFPKLDDEFVQAVRWPVQHTWQRIGHDVLDAAGGYDGIDAEGAMECVLDADHMREHGTGGFRNPERIVERDRACALIDAAITGHGYQKVLKFLARKIPLA